MGKTLTIWLGDPSQEYICEETEDEVVIMKTKDGKVIGVEILNYVSNNNQSFNIESILRTA